MRNILKVMLFVLLAGQVSAKTIPVGKNERVTAIIVAVKSAADGDTILIGPGLYREGNIIIEKSLTIIGRGSPVIDGEKKFEIFTIHGHNIHIEGLVFANTGTASISDLAGIKVLDSKHIEIVNNRFSNTFFGIYFANSSESLVSGNDLEASATAEQQIGNGIHMWKCNRITIKNNHIKGHRDGIYFEFVTNSFITANRSERNLRYGLHFMFSHDDEYRENTFLENGAGVAVMYTKGVRMIDNTFERNWGPASYGLLLKDIRDSQVTGNKFLSNSIGIFMEGSSRIHFERNVFQANGYGIKLQASCDGNTFSTNNFLSNTFDLSTNGSLVLNTINGNYWDKYEGYDLDRNNIGDVPYHPVSMYSMVVERMPTAVLLWRSFLVFMLDRAEKAIPAITPENLQDEKPQMKAYDLN
jgi:nitrous oxidase accessory protein